MSTWFAIALGDPVLRWALYVIAALAVVTLATMVQVLVLSELGARRLQRREAFEALWRPRLAETTLHDQAVYLPLTYQTSMVVHTARVDGVHFGAMDTEIPFEDMRLK